MRSLTLYIFAKKGDAKPEFIATSRVTLAPDSILGSRDIVSLAYSDLADRDADCFIVAREEYALKKGWIDRIVKVPGAFPTSRSTQTPLPSSARRANPFDD